MPDDMPGTTSQTRDASSYEVTQNGEVRWNYSVNGAGFNGAATIRTLGAQPIGQVWDGADQVIAHIPAFDAGGPLVNLRATLHGCYKSTPAAANARVKLIFANAETPEFVRPIPESGNLILEGNLSQWVLEDVPDLSQGCTVLVSLDGDTVAGNLLRLGQVSLLARHALDS